MTTPTVLAGVRDLDKTALVLRKSADIDDIDGRIHSDFCCGSNRRTGFDGALSDTTGSLFAGLALSVAILAVAALVALAQKDVRAPDARLAA